MDNFQFTFGKIHLRALEPEDLPLLYRWENDPAVWAVSNTQVPFSNYILKQYIEESHRDIYETKQLRLIIENLQQETVGAIDLFGFEPYDRRAGIGILIYNPSNRRKGYAFDALSLLKKYSQESLGLHQLYANIAAGNPASKELFAKAGFSCSGRKKEWHKTSLGWEDELIYQCLL